MSDCIPDITNKNLTSVKSRLISRVGVSGAILSLEYTVGSPSSYLFFFLGKDRLWQDQAEKMNKSVCDIKTWYDSIRTRIGRLRKTKSGQGETVFTERNRWIFSRFEFLCPHIVEVKRRTAVSMKEKVAPVVTLSSPDDAEPYDDATQEGLPGISDESGSATPQTTDIQLPSISATASHSTPKTRSTRAAVDQELMSSLTSSYKKQDQILQLSQQLLTQIKPPSADRERTNFSDWVASILHQLPYDLYKTAQRQIWTTLQHVRDEQDRREGNQASQSQQMQQPKQQQQQQQTMHNQGNQGGWQPPPNLWPQQIQGPQVSVWDSQNAVWVQQQVPGQQICQQGSPQSAQPPSASNQMPATSSASKQMPTTSGAPSSTPSDSLNLSQQSVFNLSSVTRFLADEGLQELE